MVSVAGIRRQLNDLDGKWTRKFVIHTIQLVLCLVTIICAGVVSSQDSYFQPSAWQADFIVLYYLPLVAATIVISIYFIIYTIRFSKYPNQAFMSFFHFALVLGYAAAGGYCCSVTLAASNQLNNDLYGLKNPGSHVATRYDGQVVTIDDDNVGSCPAFRDCAAQRIWLRSASARAAVAIAGCIIVMMIGVLHLLLSIISMVDATFGTHPVGWTKHMDVDSRPTTSRRRSSRHTATMSKNSLASSTTTYHTAQLPPPLTNAKGGDRAEIMNPRSSKLLIPDQRARAVVSPTMFSDRVWHAPTLDLSFKFPKRLSKQYLMDKPQPPQPMGGSKEKGPWPLKDSTG